VSTEEERELIDLIDYASTKQSKRRFDDLDRLVDVGDRIVAQHAAIAAIKEIEGNIPSDFQLAVTE